MPNLPVHKNKNTSLQLSEEEITALKSLRKAQRDASQRVEELKIKLFQMTERHMDQAVSLIRRWVQQ